MFRTLDTCCNVRPIIPGPNPSYPANPCTNPYLLGVWASQGMGQLICTWGLPVVITKFPIVTFRKRLGPDSSGWEETIYQSLPFCALAWLVLAVSQTVLSMADRSLAVHTIFTNEPDIKLEHMAINMLGSTSSISIADDTIILNNEGSKVTIQAWCKQILDPLTHCRPYHFRLAVIKVGGPSEVKVGQVWWCGCCYPCCCGGRYSPIALPKASTNSFLPLLSLPKSFTFK